MPDNGKSNANATKGGVVFGKQIAKKIKNGRRLQTPQRTTTAVRNAVGASSAKFGETEDKERKRASSRGPNNQKKADKVNDDGSVERNRQETEETMTSENYAELLRKKVIMECQSYINGVNNEPAAHALNVDRAVTLGKQVLNAMQSKKIFSIIGYYPIISEELKKRGWIEKRDPELKPLSYYENLIFQLTITKAHGAPNVDSPPSLVPTTVEALTIENTENSYIWSAIKDARPNYLFTKRNCFKRSTVSDTTTLNQLIGLTETIKSISKNVVIKFPRAYTISDHRTLEAFLKDYRLTAVLGSLKYILQSKKSQRKIFNENAAIPYEMIDFIEQRCWEFLNVYQTEDIDDILWFTTQLEESWNKFLVWYYEIVEESATIRLSNSFQINDTYERFNNLAIKIQSFCPQFFIDGSTSLWIIKPHNCCSGFGIKLERRLNNILEVLVRPDKSKQIYIVQKYIEKPLRIFNVKVDVRQYILVTNTRPMKIWMYKEGYVRFCSHKYSVEDLREAAHLSNVRVQSNYRKYRESGVPVECMWDFTQFKQYLKSINKSDTWHTSIYPSICETILTIIPKSLIQSPNKKFAFQLLGADFVLTDNFEPWLVEINSSPGLNPSTSIITRIATMLLKDIIKVTVDLPLNSNTDTGLFENIYAEQFIKPSKSKENKTKEYYYYQPPKHKKQLNK